MTNGSPEEFLQRLEEITGKKFPVPPPTGEGDDCPICRALGMRGGPVDGVVDLGKTKVMTIVTGPKPRRRPKRSR